MGIPTFWQTCLLLMLATGAALVSSKPAAGRQVDKVLSEKKHDVFDDLRSGRMLRQVGADGENGTHVHGADEHGNEEDSHRDHDHGAHDEHGDEEHENHDHGGHDEHGDEEHHDHDHDHGDEEHENHDHEEVGRLADAEDEEHDHHDHGEHGHSDHDDHDDSDDDDEDDTIHIKMIALAVLFVEAMVGAIIPLSLGNFKNLKSALSVLNCFAGGVLLATGVIHLIPHVEEYEAEADGIGDYPLGMVVIVASFCLVFYIEHILFDVHALAKEEDEAAEEETLGKAKPGHHLSHAMVQSLVLLAAIGAHSILEALALGLEDDSYTVWLLFATIAGHKGITAMAISSRFFKAELKWYESMALLFLFAVSAPISILFGLLLSDVPATTNLVLTAMSTGTFLYIGAYEVINEEFQEEHDAADRTTLGNLSQKMTRNLKFLSVFAGFLAIAGAAFIPHAHDHGGDGHDH